MHQHSRTLRAATTGPASLPHPGHGRAPFDRPRQSVTAPTIGTSVQASNFEVAVSFTMRGLAFRLCPGRHVLDYFPLFVTVLLYI